MCLQYREGDFSWKPCDSTLNTSNSSSCPLACYACEAEFEHYCPIVSSEKQIFTVDDDGRYIWLLCFSHFLSENEILHISVILCKNNNSCDDFWVQCPLLIPTIMQQKATPPQGQDYSNKKCSLALVRPWTQSFQPVSKKEDLMWVKIWTSTFDPFRDN